MKFDVYFLFAELFYIGLILGGMLYIFNFFEITYNLITGKIQCKKISFRIINEYLFSHMVLLLSQKRICHYNESELINWAGCRLLFILSMSIILILPLSISFLELHEYYNFYQNHEYGLLWVFFYLIGFPLVIILMDLASQDKHVVFNGVNMLSKLLFQMLPLFLVLISLVINTQSASIEQIVNEQQAFVDIKAGSWGLVRQPLGAIVFFLYALFFIEIFSSNTTTDFMSKTQKNCLAGIDRFFYESAIKTYAIVWVLFIILFFMGGVPSFPGLIQLKSVNIILYKAILFVSLLCKFSFILFLIYFFKWFFYSFKNRFFWEKNWYIILPIATMDLIATIIIVHSRY
ncbi:MAG: hypothetical protein A2381_08910 [Bdellovibrionales bacterium RIFOXYB1_FULL_37_110]|nr:MAG: hypothetical protein A2181_09105 [Bdellovibrionales bacterium RIFOXYA1_FULL_38_20]OFZ50348.1 MAG: hypothetical protein A2417_09010 [Bdellovibrionales bacterium RIFOXYC1_FULL_37_79]OFZ60957.1 MAG: hypothetical protein A2381_08910 [Bdellovibrionales bacterium RIFOXYB1_FULL_37_110]OFZ63701.1 MAG: hypothetical protein A2577_08030 [Bdellovibrionales bacterium RIFOXYD1_FULL_36_51]